MKRDVVTPELHAEVLARDGECFLHRLDADHVCRDQWGRQHDPRINLTVDHVNDGGAKMGKRAPSDAQHLVAMCAKANIDGPSRVVRHAEREYLEALYAVLSRDS